MDQSGISAVTLCWERSHCSGVSVHHGELPETAHLESEQCTPDPGTGHFLDTTFAMLTEKCGYSA